MMEKETKNGILKIVHNLSEKEKEISGINWTSILTLENHEGKMSLKWYGFDWILIDKKNK